MKQKNPNKRTEEDKEKQRSEGGGEHFKKHGTAKSRLRDRNRAMAARKREAEKN